MATDILQLLQDYNVNALTEGHKHCRPGWVNMPCPFCTGHDGLHLGATLDGSTFFCWRCGWHSPSSSIAKLLKIDERKAKELLKQYLGITRTVQEVKRKVRSKAHKYPSDTGPLQERHKKYLEKRRFDPDQLEHDWGLLGTGMVSLLGDSNDVLNYSHRILAPIYWNGEEVTFQARDITNKHPLKYMACPEERELIKHKHILDGKQEKWTNKIIIVEGITDVWRFGFNAAATLGIKYTPSQLRLISSLFKEVFVIFDDEKQAQEQASQLVADLNFRGVSAHRIRIQGDPGEMSQAYANALVKSLGF
jgi:hypothetical protein